MFLAMRTSGFVFLVSCLALEVSSAAAQESAARGAPVLKGPQYARIPGPVAGFFEESITARDGEHPAGIEPLDRDLYTTRDFYKDRELWTDPRYFRCASPAAIEGMRGGAGEDTLGSAPVEAAPWGHCDRGYPAEGIISPYPFESAQEHWNALLAEARSRGGPRTYTLADMPDWSGQYVRQYRSALRTDDTPGPSRQAPVLDSPAEYPYWMWGEITQASTFVPLLTPEYQKRLVQDLYHDAVTNAPQWPYSYCWPEGLLRWWTGTIDLIHIVARPEEIVMLGQGVGSSVRVLQNGREFILNNGVPHLTQPTPRWYGETITFWDGEALIAWTSNVPAWTSHQLFENSNKLQVIEIYTPVKDAGGTTTGLVSESVFYDEEAFVRPLRQVLRWHRMQELNVGEPYGFAECLQTIFPIDGRPVQVPPGTTIEYTVPNMFDRPWARIQERHFESGMESESDSEAVFGRFR
jgi:hypothetical protein